MLVALRHAVRIEGDDAVVGDGDAKDVTGEIAQHGLVSPSPQRVQWTTHGLDQVASGRTRSGRRLANAALSLPRTSLANAGNGTRKRLRAGCQCRPSSATPPPVVQLCSATSELRAPCGTWMSKSTTRLRSQRRSMSEILRQSCRALPLAHEGETSHEPTCHWQYRVPPSDRPNLDT